MAVLTWTRRRHIARELLIAVPIVGLLVAIAAPGVLRLRAHSMRSEPRVDVKALFTRQQLPSREVDQKPHEQTPASAPQTRSVEAMAVAGSEDDSLYDRWAVRSDQSEFLNLASLLMPTSALPSSGPLNISR